MSNPGSKEVEPELNRLTEIQQRYSNTVDYPGDTYEIRANDLAWLINEVELSRTRVPVAGTAPRVDKVADLIPTNWLDPLLTGSDAVIGKPPYNCADIERLLRAVKERIAGSGIVSRETNNAHT